MALAVTHIDLDAIARLEERGFRCAAFDGFDHALLGDAGIAAPALRHRLARAARTGRVDGPIRALLAGETERAHGLYRAAAPGLELVAATSGLGYRITTAQRFFQTDTIFGYLLLLGILGLTTDQAMKLAARRLFRYLPVR